MIARIEYPRSMPGPYLDQLDAHRPRGAPPRRGGAGVRATRRRTSIPTATRSVMALNDVSVRASCASSATSVQYEDPRNSCLNEVLDRRTGIPITLALVYMEVARRAGLHVEGVNFPGHFLLRCPAPARPARTPRI